jgi:AcrR family transcriptional regulator
MGKRQETRERIEAQIIELGRRQLVTERAAGLSLRAIARELGMVSSAVYRYVASRDDLLTLLLVEAYTDLADAAERAQREAGESWREQIGAIAHAARSWAVATPAGWALLYGSPVPGYRAPADRTVGPGTRVVAALFRAVGSGIADGTVRSSETSAPQSLRDDLGGWRQEFGFPGDDAVLVRCTTLWAGIVGAISLEVFGQYGSDALADPVALFDQQIALLLDLVAG